MPSPKVRAKRVPPSISSSSQNWCRPDVAKASYYKLDELAPVGKIEDLANFDAVIVGTGTRFGPTAS
jgi:hypothetical protein